MRLIPISHYQHRYIRNEAKCYSSKSQKIPAFGEQGDRLKSFIVKEKAGVFKYSFNKILTINKKLFKINRVELDNPGPSILWFLCDLQEGDYKSPGHSWETDRWTYS